MRKCSNFISIIITMNADDRISGNNNLMLKDFLVLVLQRIQHDLVGTIPDGIVIGIFGGMSDLKF